MGRWPFILLIEVMETLISTGVMVDASNSLGQSPIVGVYRHPFIRRQVMVKRRLLLS